jgi:hypothetical protein
MTTEKDIDKTGTTKKDIDKTGKDERKRKKGKDKPSQVIVSETIMLIL